MKPTQPTVRIPAATFPLACRRVVVIPTDDLAHLGFGETVEAATAGGVQPGKQFAAGRRAFALFLQQPPGVIVGQVPRADRVKFESGHGAGPAWNSHPIYPKRVLRAVELRRFAHGHTNLSLPPKCRAQRVRAPHAN